ncbi:hypothetical protein Dip510_000535 [Elusimicrobium posterum]|uniref:trypsin-like serine protease n=1 Tax=Elusimicrobium posterum TaxID=3116653 RepID=UPI003C70CE37
MRIYSVFASFVFFLFPALLCAQSAQESLSRAGNTIKKASAISSEKLWSNIATFKVFAAGKRNHSMCRALRINENWMLTAAHCFAEYEMSEEEFIESREDETLLVSIEKSAQEKDSFEIRFLRMPAQEAQKRMLVNLDRTPPQDNVKAQVYYFKNFTDKYSYRGSTDLALVKFVLPENNQFSSKTKYVNNIKKFFARPLNSVKIFVQSGGNSKLLEKQSASALVLRNGKREVIKSANVYNEEKENVTFWERNSQQGGDSGSPVFVNDSCIGFVRGHVTKANDEFPSLCDNRNIYVSISKEAKNFIAQKMGNEFKDVENFFEDSLN